MTTNQIAPLSKDQVARLYDFLHSQWAEARDEYLAADAAAEEEFHRGRREAMDAALSELDRLVDQMLGIVE